MARISAKMNDTSHGAAKMDLGSNLLIDKDHDIFRGPLFIGEHGSIRKKARDLLSPVSEDAVTWSVFRTLSRIPPSLWLGQFVEGATGGAVTVVDEDSTGAECELCTFWPSVPAPTSRLIWLLEHLDDPRIRGSKGASLDPERVQRIQRRLVHYLGKAREGRLQSALGVLSRMPDESVAPRLSRGPTAPAASVV
jgi:hypothetical protein